MGFINRKGEVVIEPLFDYGEDFENGLALMVKDNILVYINRKGDVVWTGGPGEVPGEEE